MAKETPIDDTSTASVICELRDGIDNLVKLTVFSTILLSDRFTPKQKLKAKEQIDAYGRSFIVDF
ncbi:MAG: hypothetical protein Q7S58_00795 [Candidatus Binatus sp.]|uniref:hypothetical protein n=1 Tax=Candidatus Binatus sp. TaxID=2811406 RepID=UPI002728CFA9|nr:hypothetical protein [Candidatus Binatus sp.]MDO8430924.1 hypothetical protein [Candidatus Binatus sp.]